MSILTVESAKQAVAEKYGKSSWDLLMRYGWFEHTADEEEREKERILDEVHEMVDDELARLAAELEKHRWIPVEERLPEMGKRVMIYTAIQHLGTKIGLCSYNGWITEQGTPIEVTHWRYLHQTV